MTEATKFELFTQFAEMIEDDFGMQYDREENFYICPECGDPIYFCDLISNPDYNWYTYECPVCGFRSDSENDFYEPPEKQWSPSNPWDAPGMSIKDFL